LHNIDLSFKNKKFYNNFFQFCVHFIIRNLKLIPNSYSILDIIYERLPSKISDDESESFKEKLIDRTLKYLCKNILEIILEAEKNSIFKINLVY